MNDAIKMVKENRGIDIDLDKIDFDDHEVYKMIGEGKSKKEINDYMESTTIEGLYTSKSIYKLIKNKHVDMPIIDLIYDIIYKDVDPNELATFLINKK